MVLTTVMEYTVKTKPLMPLRAEGPEADPQSAFVAGGRVGGINFFVKLNLRLASCHNRTKMQTAII